MQRSISGRTRSQGRGPGSLAAIGSVLLILGLGSASLGADFIDDAKVKADFESKLTALFKAGGLTTGSAIAAQLRSAKRGEFPFPTAEETATDVKDEGAAFSRARAGTLVLGHLYLCGKCDLHHANLAGGVLVSPDGLALTNYHVLDFGEAIVFGAMTADGRVFPIDKVLAASKRDDVALVKLRGAEGLPCAPFGQSPELGEAVFAVSHPDGHFYTLTRGHLARKYLTPKGGVPRLQITADFARGSSGCGIFNEAGGLVGIATSTNSIHYTEEEGRKANLQMVVKSGVPLESIRALFAE